jgi:4-hydroxy-2-oxoglutarate aldolase
VKPPVDLSGVFPPIPTPFDAEGNVAYDALVGNLERWNETDLAGYVVIGSNGEAVYLTEQEKDAIWRTARSVIPQDKLLIAGTGCESTRETISLTCQAAQAGADAVLVITPHYYGGKMTSGALLAHYQAVADASPIPVMLYNVPKFTHLDMDAPTIAQAARHPNIVGIKDSGGNIAKIAEVVRLAGTGFQVLAGSASFLFAALALGAVGGVVALSNVAPEQAIGIYRLYKAGRWDEAAELQRRMLPVNAAVTARFGIAGLKAALDILGYYGGPVRSPLRDLQKEDRQIVRAILAEGGLL